MRIPYGANLKEPVSYYFMLLPPVKTGEVIRRDDNGIYYVQFGGPDRRTPYYENGQHWYQRYPYECPRVHDQTECPVCDFARKVLADGILDSTVRTSITRNFLAKSRWLVNIYLVQGERNPPELRGRVMRFNMPRSVIDQMPPTYKGVFKLVATKRGDWNEYSVIFREDANIYDKFVTEEVLRQRHDLSDMFKSRNKDALSSILSGLKEMYMPVPAVIDPKTGDVKLSMEDMTDEQFENVLNKLEQINPRKVRALLNKRQAYMNDKLGNVGKRKLGI